MTLPPVVWKPTTKFGFPYPGARGRSLPVLAFVRHRIVGSLASADGVFASTSSSQASTHFGIGHIDGRLEIHQYVDLSDSAWGNGDVREPTARVVLQNPGVNPNIYTISIEHEDGGYVGRGRVPSDVWTASLQLGLLLASGNIEDIRAAGVRCRSTTTAHQMSAVPKDIHGYIDHHQISGPNKPYCFRRWLDDPGFVEGSPSRRDQLLTALSSGVLPDTSTGADMTPVILRPVQEDWTAHTGDPGGVFFTGGPDLGERKTFITPERVTSIAETEDGVWRVLAYGPEVLWMKRVNLTPVPDTRRPTTGFGLAPAADCSALEAEVAEQQATINSQTARISALVGAASAKNAVLDAAVLHEKSHVDLSAALQAARSR